MTPSQRIVVNTTAQYTRTVINVCLSLYSTRLVLAALGQTDFGIFSVVAGVVSMLAFMTNALVTTTQRYLSFYHGKGDLAFVSHVFGNSLLLHILIGVCVFSVLGVLAYPIVYGMLNIDAGRETAAMFVYFSAIFILMLIFITAPFRALFIARENIVYISVIDVLDGVFRLLIAAFLVYFTSHDKLITYSVLLIGISLFNLLAFAGYALRHFAECHIPKWREFDKSFIKDLGGFAGWTVYSSGCVIIRNQGIAVLINVFCGAIGNAAYGIAQQVSGAVAFLSTSIVNAINPQIMSAEGQGNRARMLQLAEYESKYAFLLLSMISIPLIFEMETILRIWLTEVPEYAVSFCQLMLLAAIFDQLSIGLTSANQAIGQIKVFTLWFYSFKLFTLVGIGICLYVGVPVTTSLWCYVGMELFGSVLRLVLMKYQADINILQFIRNVCYRVIVPFITMAAISYVSVHYITIPYRFMITIILSALGGSIAIWFTSLQMTEKQSVYEIVRRIKRH